jgi:phosphate/sulfate permease
MMSSEIMSAVISNILSGFIAAIFTALLGMITKLWKDYQRQKNDLNIAFSKIRELEKLVKPEK